MGRIKTKVKVSNLFKKMKNFCFLLMVITAITGCTIKNYKVIGYFENYNEIFVGEVNFDLIASRGNFTVEGKVSNIKCEGEITLVHIPQVSLFSGEGWSGTIFGTCSDKRTLEGSYITTSRGRGFGQGFDNIGNKLTFRFGLSEREVETEIKNLLQMLKDKPPLPQYQPSTKDQINL
jgi:hypothetical protein